MQSVELLALSEWTAKFSTLPHSLIHSESASIRTLFGQLIKVGTLISTVLAIKLLNQSLTHNQVRTDALD
jgi:hypothetical protein